MFEQAMFADSMLETSWAQRSRRSWTTLTSFGLQAVVIGCLLLIAVVEDGGIAAARTVSTPISMGRPDARACAANHGARSTAVPRSCRTSVRSCSLDESHGHSDGGDDPSLQAGRYRDGPGPIGLPGSGSDPHFRIPIIGTQTLLPAPPAPTVRPFRTSSMLEGS